MKKIKKFLILASALTMPTLASPQTCNCLGRFNDGFNPLYSMYTTCVSNYLWAPVAAWANYASGGGGGGSVSSATALQGLQNCDNTFSNQLSQLQNQYDYCVQKYCN